MHGAGGDVVGGAGTRRLRPLVAAPTSQHVSSPFVSPLSLSLSLSAPLSTHSLTQAKLRKDMQSSDPAQQNGDLRSAWTKTEDEIILSSVNEFGPKWVEIAGRLPGRTEHAARNRYHRLVSRTESLMRGAAEGGA